MFNVSDLLSVFSTVSSGVESQTKETLIVMLPIVGITVVIFSLALLAIVLSLSLIHISEPTRPY